MDINDGKIIIGLLLSIWFAGYAAGASVRLLKQIIERASRP